MFFLKKIRAHLPQHFHYTAQCFENLWVKPTNLRCVSWRFCGLAKWEKPCYYIDTRSDSNEVRRTTQQKGRLQVKLQIDSEQI